MLFDKLAIFETGVRINLSDNSELLVDSMSLNCTKDQSICCFETATSRVMDDQGWKGDPLRIHQSLCQFLFLDSLLLATRIPVTTKRMRPIRAMSIAYITRKWNFMAFENRKTPLSMHCVQSSTARSTPSSARPEQVPCFWRL